MRSAGVIVTQERAGLISEQVRSAADAEESRHDPGFSKR